MKPENAPIQFIGDRPGQVFRHTCDRSKAEKLLDWRPRISFEDGLARTIEWYRDERGLVAAADVDAQHSDRDRWAASGSSIDLVVERLRRIHHRLPPPLRRISSAAVDVARRRRAELGSARSRRSELAWLRDRRSLRDQLYAWWWWRSPNRPPRHHRPMRISIFLDHRPRGVRGLDLGSPVAVRQDAIHARRRSGERVDVVGDGHAAPLRRRHVRLRLVRTPSSSTCASRGSWPTKSCAY